ncbi:MAG: TonB-dependent receptor [Stagnimonas sp.]|nr:TonB-dependent receptor [Stagnimonas sp.]
MFKPSLLAIAAAMLASPAFADPVILEPVQVTAGRLPEPGFELPQPLTVLDAEAIDKKSPQVMAELLRGEAGVYFQQTGPGQGMAIVRGLKGAEVLHLVDGFRLNNAFFRTAPSQYIALVDPWNIEQLEVLRGPYATLYGPDAMGGVIQIRTPEARFEGSEVGYRTEAKLHYGSADLAKIGRVSHAVGNDRLSVSGGYTTASYGNRQIGGDQGQSADGQGNIRFGDTVGPGEYTSRAYDLKSLWAPTASDELMLSLQYFDVPDGFFRYNEMVPGSKPITGSNPARAQSVYFNSREFYHLRWRHTAPLGFIDSLEAHLGRQVIDDDRYDLLRNLTRQEREKNRSTLDGFTLAARSALGGAQQLSYGIELYRDAVKSAKYRSDAGGPFNPNSPSTGFKSRFPNGARSDNFGVYLSDAWRFAPDWLLDVGGRVNQTSTELPAAPESDRAVAGKIDNTDYSAQLGLRYAITPNLAWASNLGRGYRAPNINDLAQVGDRAGGRVVVANTGLKPESLLSADTGLKFRGGSLAGEATLFYARYEDRITLINPAVPNGEQGCTEADGCAQNQNIAEATYYGFEGALRYRLLPKLLARATLNYTWAEQKNGGLTEPGNRVPPLNGLLALAWQPLAKVELEPSLWFNDSQHRLDSADRADNRIAEGGTAGFAVLNLAGRWSVGENLRLQLMGENLLDKSYREHASGIDARGRGVSLTLEAAF